MRPLEEMRERAGASLANAAVLAVVLTVVAFAVRHALDPYIGDKQPYTPAFAAIAFAVWFGGWRAAVICTLLANLVANYFFIQPRYTFTMNQTEIIAAASYYFTAAIIIYLGHRARRANRQLAREAAQKDVFIATLSHELRNPLAPIVSTAHILSRAVAPGTEARPAVEILQRQSRHMARLLDDLLDLSRITQGRLAIRRDAVDICRCVHDAAESVRDSCSAKGQHLDVREAAGGVRTVGDSTRITQIVANLLNNASKYSPQGARITAFCERRAGEACIVVADNGPGIDPELLPDLFEPFNKNDPRRGTGTSANGLGIGLWLANRLAQLHGGRIEVRSEGGAGTTFTIHLPAANEA